MPIEKDVRRAIEKFTFNKSLPEFIDRAKFLEERLKEGEKLSVGIDKFGFSDAPKATNFVYLELQKTEGKQRVAILSHVGEIAYITDIFKDYKPSPKSQRRR